MDHQKELKTLSTRAETAQSTLKTTQLEVDKLKTQVQEAESKARTVQGELDDLLLVLGELEEKQSLYREKIKALGGEVTDDEDE